MFAQITLGLEGAGRGWGHHYALCSAGTDRRGACVRLQAELELGLGLLLRLRLGFGLGYFFFLSPRKRLPRERILTPLLVLG